MVAFDHLVNTIIFISTSKSDIQACTETVDTKFIIINTLELYLFPEVLVQCVVNAGMNT